MVDKRAQDRYMDLKCCEFSFQIYELKKVFWCFCVDNHWIHFLKNWHLAISLLRLFKLNIPRYIKTADEEYRRPWTVRYCLDYHFKNHSSCLEIAKSGQWITHIKSKYSLSGLVLNALIMNCFILQPSHYQLI